MTTKCTNCPYAAPHPHSEGLWRELYLHVPEHNTVSGRDATDCHPMSAISGLVESLHTVPVLEEDTGEVKLGTLRVDTSQEVPTLVWWNGEKWVEIESKVTQPEEEL